MPKNYYIYFHEGKVKRQAINLNDIYPESYAEAKIPNGSDVFAMIITSNTVNKRWAGYHTKNLSSRWIGHTLWTDYYPDMYCGVMLDKAFFYWEKQVEYINKFLPLITLKEKELIAESTQKTFERLSYSRKP